MALDEPVPLVVLLLDGQPARRLLRGYLDESDVRQRPTGEGQRSDSGQTAHSGTKQKEDEGRVHIG